TRLALEGDPDHPADYEGVAALTPDEFETLLTRYPSARERLLPTAEQRGGDWLIAYRKLLEGPGEPLPDGLADELSRRDVYELPLERSMALLADKWRRFGETAANERVAY